MEKSKRILIVLIILLIVMAVMVAILINTNKKQEVSHGNNTYTSIVNEQDEAFEKVNDYKTYFTVKEIVENYITYMKQINGDEYVDASSLQTTTTQIATVMQEDGIEALKGILDEGYLKDETDNSLIKMQDDYKCENRGIEIIKVEDGYQLATKKEMYEYLYPIFDKRSKPNLSNASMETLAIIAYNPKITRAEIEAIRGVNSDGTIYKLLEYNLIENVGKADLPGRPTMYSTTENFLKMFGISSLEELPDLPRYKLDENEQIVIEDVMNEQEKSKVNSTDSNTQENTDEIQMEAPMPEREN